MSGIVVKSGDTLWGIAKRELGNPFMWREIFRLNRSVIERAQKVDGRRHLQGPDWIYPGTILSMPFRPSMGDRQ